MSDDRDMIQRSPNERIFMAATPSSLWIRAHEDAGEIVGEVQTARLYEDRVEYDDGSVVTECPWDPTLVLESYLISLDYEPPIGYVFDDGEVVVA